MMRVNKAFGVLLGVAAVASTLAACTDAQPTPPTGTATQSSPSTPTSPGPTASPTRTLTPDEIKVAAGDRVVRRFWAIQDELRQKADRPISELARVTRGTAYETWSQQLQYFRVQQYTQVGESKLLTVNGVVAGAKPRPKVTVTVCYDVSGVQVRDKNGKSALPSSRPVRGKAIYTVEQYKDGWFITDDITRGEPCDA